MHLPVPAVLIGVFIRTSLGASLGVIDQDRQCLIWSNDNHACTGYSEPFAEINGTDCSELSELVNGTRKDFSIVSVGACGSENGKDVAWITITHTGEVTFFNQNGDKSGCTLNNGLRVGSWCSAHDYELLTATGLSSVPMISTTATVSSSSTFSSSSIVSSSSTVSSSSIVSSSSAVFLSATVSDTSASTCACY